jgi:hypothetical protein
MGEGRDVATRVDTNMVGHFHDDGRRFSGVLEALQIAEEGRCAVSLT